MEELKNPIVFQCKACNYIVGDSFFLVARVDPYFVFEAMPGVTEGSAMQCSGKGMDANCMYFDLLCVCKAKVGRKYQTVTEEMSQCVGKYCIVDASVTGYQLGEGTAKDFPMNAAEMAAEILRLQKFCSYLYSHVKSAAQE